MPGTLFVVATPIGNLEDLTFRALRTLREVDLVAAEDTRRTSKLLAHYEIRKSMVSLREHNERREGPRLVSRMLAGESVALVTDAGTPGISDPGADFVRLAREAGLAVVPIPGPSAVVAALSVSGFPAGEFVFLGFPPPSGQRREDWFERLFSETRTAVFFEAPHRVSGAISKLHLVCVDRPIIVLREMTKLHESIGRLTNEQDNEGVARSNVAGEFVIILGPKIDFATTGDVNSGRVEQIVSKLDPMRVFSEGELCQVVAALSGTSPVKAANLIKKARISVKRQNRAADQA